MNDSVANIIRKACNDVRSNGIQIQRGIWFEWSGTKIIACDALGAVLIAHNAIPENINPLDVNTLSRPGFTKAICIILDVDTYWLRNFWMGFDRNYQIVMLDDKEKIIGKEEISKFGISLWRELNK